MGNLGDVTACRGKTCLALFLFFAYEAISLLGKGIKNA